MELKNSQTYKNLEAALEREVLARSKYEFFAEKARQDGFNDISSVFSEIAAQEREHAKVWYKLLYGELPATAQNLENAVGSEDYEQAQMYPDYAQKAREEGFPDIAAKFDMVAQIEQKHENRFKTLLDNINGGKLFSSDGDVMWKCTNCGHVHIGKEAPETCPVCSHSQGYFVKAEN